MTRRDWLLGRVLNHIQIIFLSEFYKFQSVLLGVDGRKVCGVSHFMARM